jgi:hypothetical protein
MNAGEIGSVIVIPSARQPWLKMQGADALCGRPSRAARQVRPASLEPRPSNVHVPDDTATTIFHSNRYTAQSAWSTARG